MNTDRREFLSLAIQPARLTIAETGWYLGFSDHDVSVLASLGLLKPLGHPPLSGSKYFALVELEKLRSDPRWLGRACDTIVKYWKDKNAGRSATGSASKEVSLTSEASDGGRISS